MIVYGHRGAAGEAPENTLAGFRHAIDRGVRHFEFDLNLSKDGELMVIHDTSVDRTTWHTGRVEDYTAKELLKMDARRNTPPWGSKKQTGIITLDTLLANIPEAKHLQLEVKKRSNKTMAKVAAMMAERFPSRKAGRRISVTSMSKDLHRHLIDIAPHISRGLVTLSPEAHVELKEMPYDLIALSWGGCSKPVVRKLHDAGVQVSCWTVNEPQVVKSLFKMGVDSVITDYPSMAIPLIGSLMRTDNQVAA